MSTADDLRRKIFAAMDISSEVLDVPEWGVKIKLRAPTVRARAELVRIWMRDESPDPQTVYPALLIATCVDPDTDAPLFTEADTDALLEKSGAVVERIVSEALKVAGMDANAVDRGKADSAGTTSAPT